MKEKPIVNMLPIRSLWSDRLGAIPTPTYVELVREYRGLAGACASLNASTVAKLKYSLHRGPDDEAPEVKDHPFLETLKHPNPHMGVSQLLKLTQLYLEMTGVCYWRIIPGVLNPVSMIYPLQSHLVMPKFGINAQLEGYWYNAPQPNSIWLTTEEIVPFRVTDVENPYGGGKGPAQLAWTEICLLNGDSALMYALQQNNAMPGTLLSPKDAQGVVPKSVVERLTAWWNSYRGGRSGRVAVPEIPIEVTQLAQTSKEFEGSDRFDNISSIILACFAIPGALFKSAGSRAELDAALVQYHRLAIDPRTALLEDVINRRLTSLYTEEKELTLWFEKALEEDEDQQVDPKTGLPTAPNPSTGTIMNPKKENTDE